MSSIQQMDVQSLIGRPVVTNDGRDVGMIKDIFYDDATSVAKWASVTNGGKTHYVPLRDASMKNDSIVINYSNDLVTTSPQFKDNDMDINDADASSHYNISDNESPSMELHREELNVGKREVSGGTARIHKYTVEKQVSVPVMLREEHAKLVVDDTSANRVSDASIGDAFQDKTVDVVLNREEPVVNKTVVQTGRAHVQKDVTERQENITDNVREEQIELEDSNVIK